MVSMAKVMQVIDQTDQANKRIRVFDETSWRNADELVRIITAQTSVHFDREPRQMEVWFITDDGNKAQPHTQPSVASD